MNRESQNIEFKESWRDEYLKWICGFANAMGGKLYIGKDDRGNVVQLDNVKKLSEDIPNKVRDVLGIMVDVNILEENGFEYKDFNFSWVILFVGIVGAIVLIIYIIMP